MHLSRNIRRLIANPVAIFCFSVAIVLAAIHVALPEGARTAVEERALSGRHVRTLEHALTTTWWMTLAGSLIMLIAALTSQFWASRQHAPHTGVPPSVGQNNWTRRWWIVVALILIIAGGIRFARLNLSLYNDEAYSVRRHMVGDFKGSVENDDLRFRTPPWVNTLWFSEVGNNSPPYSVLARCSYALAARAFDFAEGEIREWPLRFPAWLAGLAGILCTGLVARQFGTADRGLIAMAIAALHPWHIRYSSEARGHSLLLLLIPLLILLIIKAMKNGTWRNWLLVGLTHMLTMWAFPGAMYVLASFNLALGAWMFFLLRQYSFPHSSVFTQLQRWLLSTGFGALLFILVYGPAIMQMKMTVAQVESLHSDTPWSWWQNIGALIISGQPWNDPNTASTISHSLSRSWSDGAMIPPVLAGLTVLLTLAAGILILRRPLIGWLVFAATLPALTLAFFTSKISQTVLHEWYTLSSLPMVIVLMALGMTAVLHIASKRWTLAPPAILFSAWVISIEKPLLLQQKNGVQPIRNVVEEVRGSAFPYEGGDHNRTIFAAFWADISIYDPNLIVLKNLAELKTLEIEAEKNNKNLVVCFAHRDLALHSHHALVKELETSGKYLRVNVLYGFGADQFNHHLFRKIQTRVGSTN